MSAVPRCSTGCGRCHRASSPQIARRDGVLYVNPGSAGPRRFRLPVAVARIHVHRDALEAEIVTLSTHPSATAVASPGR
jgi:predicted phosphodiesterase